MYPFLQGLDGVGRHEDGIRVPQRRLPGIAAEAMGKMCSWHRVTESLVLNVFGCSASKFDSYHG